MGRGEGGMGKGHGKLDEKRGKEKVDLPFPYSSMGVTVRPIIQSGCPWSAVRIYIKRLYFTALPVTHESNLSRNDPRRFDFHSGPLAVGGEGAFAVDGVAQGVDDSTEQFVAHGDVDDGSRPLHDVALFDQLVVAEDHDADVVCGRKETELAGLVITSSVVVCCLLLLLLFLLL